MMSGAAPIGEDKTAQFRYLIRQNPVKGTT